MEDERKARLRALPKVDAVLSRPEIQCIAAPRWAVLEAVRAEINRLRQAIRGGAELASEVLPSSVERRALALAAPRLRPVINATGVVLHTNLGRAPLAREACEAAMEVATGYSNLEYDLDRGSRGSRHSHLTALIRDLTGAEDAVVVNNNAGAVLLGLAALAAGREVIVSRGELVEIGGSFRIPDVMRMSQARLVEVGTTNKTRIADYRSAITGDTALLLKVHRSNFAVVGFTAEVSEAELAALGRDMRIASMLDLGSGSLLRREELRALGLPDEPGVAEAVAAGIDVVAFSGDKLLGGPQAGILCGHRDAMAAVRSHPLMRALRPDKMTIAALAATLALYRDGRARTAVPALAMLAAQADALRMQAESVAARIMGALAERATHPLLFAVAPRACTSTVGGGAMPLSALPSWAVALVPAGAASAVEIDQRLRAAARPVIARITRDERGEVVLLDLRTVQAQEIEALIATVASAAVACAT